MASFPTFFPILLHNQTFVLCVWLLWSFSFVCCRSPLLSSCFDFILKYVMAMVAQMEALVSNTNDGSIEITSKLQVLFSFLWECSSILNNKTSQC